MEFRQYQTWIQGIPNDDNDDDDAPSTSQKTTVNKFENFRKERSLQQMQWLLPHEERLCYDSLMGLIFRQGGFIQSGGVTGHATTLQYPQP